MAAQAQHDDRSQSPGSGRKQPLPDHHSDVAPSGCGTSWLGVPGTSTAHQTPSWAALPRSSECSARWTEMHKAAGGGGRFRHVQPSAPFDGSAFWLHLQCTKLSFSAQGSSSRHLAILADDLVWCWTCCLPCRRVRCWACPPHRDGPHRQAAGKLIAGATRRGSASSLLPQLCQLHLPFLAEASSPGAARVWQRVTSMLSVLSISGLLLRLGGQCFCVCPTGWQLLTGTLLLS